MILYIYIYIYISHYRDRDTDKRNHFSNMTLISSRLLSLVSGRLLPSQKPTRLMTAKTFGCLSVACRLLVGCLSVACWLLVGCLLVACWLLVDCCSVACRSLVGCLSVACWLLCGCLLVAFLLLFGGSLDPEHVEAHALQHDGREEGDADVSDPLQIWFTSS